MNSHHANSSMHSSPVSLGNDYRFPTPTQSAHLENLYHIPTPNQIHRPPLSIENHHFIASCKNCHSTPSSKNSHYFTTAKTFLKLTLPSTKNIPLLAGKHDWGPWHTAVWTLINCSNFLGHVHENMLPGAQYNPDLEPSFSPTITHDSP
jgi:hypothetical protein